MKMRLEILNFAKIKKADIRIDGITVIAGENNTGKSTVGKILYSVFNSVYDIASKVEASRKNEIVSRCRSVIRTLLMQKEREGNWESNIRPSRAVELAFRELNRRLNNADIFMLSETELRDMFLNVTEKYGMQIEDELADEFAGETLRTIEFVNKTEDYTIAVELIERFFNSVFSNQIVNLGNNKPAEIKLTIQGKEIEFQFVENRCSLWKTNIDILHEAFFVDDPFILDELGYSYIEKKTTRSLLVDRIEKINFSEDENVVNSIWAKEKLKEIFDILNRVVPGGIEDSNGEWALAMDRYSEPIRFDNLSAGLKSFVLLKILLEKSILKEKDVLILDEPEIHLHPEWQIKYAEIIVLLQKKFDLSIIVTTHSRDFFEAIELFAKKYNMMDKCSFYLSRQSENEVEFEDVSEDISRIYKHLVTPSRLLDKLKFELEESEND